MKSLRRQPTPRAATRRITARQVSLDQSRSARPASHTVPRAAQAGGGAKIRASRRVTRLSGAQILGALARLARLSLSIEAATRPARSMVSARPREAGAGSSLWRKRGLCRPRARHLHCSRGGDWPRRPRGSCGALAAGCRLSAFSGASSALSIQYQAAGARPSRRSGSRRSWLMLRLRIER